MDDLHLLNFYFEEAPIMKGDSRHSSSIVKRFDSWVDGNTLATLITELIYCLTSLGYDKEVVKSVMQDVTESL